MNDIDRLIAKALTSPDAAMRELAEAAQCERERGRGRPRAKLPNANDPEFGFHVMCALEKHKLIGWMEGDPPTPITRVSAEPVKCIATALAPRWRVSYKTLEPIVREALDSVWQGRMGERARRILHASTYDPEA